eukprot:TRINITY_DN80632_c0_g1_i1.p1 TRINITY_DN80632_c0_g1~~TRINITY_DN80632_c0_g1_i1.p1  ORF type:complete len:135 (-),score=11.22 TRINITY_DN80632_c0_g1_i1:366-770(-)
MGVTTGALAGLAFLFSVGIGLQLLACALYNNWWPMLSALMYLLLPMPCLFFSTGDSNDFFLMGTDNEWQDAAKFLTGFSAVGSVAIPFILHHGHLISLGATLLTLAAFAVLTSTLALFIRVSMDDGYSMTWSSY